MRSTSRPPAERARGHQARLARLARTDPACAERIRPYLTAPPAGGPEPVEGVPLPPATEPLNSAVRDWVREGDTPAPPDIVIVLGTGEWCEIACLRDQLPAESRILVLEWDVEHLADLFRRRLIERDLADGRVRLVPGADTEAVVEAYQALLNLPAAPSTRVFDRIPAAARAREFYTGALQQICSKMNLSLFNLGTLVYLGPLWQFNTLQNLPLLLANPGVDALRGAFPQKPAVVVAAGPSLEDALQTLPRVCKQFVVICTGTALKPLRRAGVEPDLVVSVDASHKTGPQFETACEHLYLACSSLAFPPVLPKFKGLFSGYHSSNPVGAWVSRFGTPKGLIAACGTVTASAMDLAVKMGCNPVLTVGMDLSFSDDGTTHANGTIYEGRRLDPTQLRAVPGNYQDDVLTTSQFHCYIRLIEQYVQKHPRTRFVNLTTRGARIAGMELARPASIVEYAAGPFDAYGVIARRHAAFDEDLGCEVAAEIDAVIEQLEDIIRDSRRAAMLCNRLMMLFQRPCPGDEVQAAEWLQALHAIDRRLVEADRSSCLLEMSLRPATFNVQMKRQQHEERLCDSILAHRRFRTLYEQIAGAASWTRDLLQKAGRRLRAGASRPKEAQPA
ncbi:MAG: motility associated factor glycosyltransferase family protein [Kiritimatiellae bacterium]|nr:motility associated factor glycosyltransferase family protein [Kiritimatiellia bacterium]